MYALALLAVLLSVVQSQLSNDWNRELTLSDLKEFDVNAAFKSWSDQFNRSYISAEEKETKQLVWIDNIYKIAAHNSENLAYKYRLNQFGDWTTDEFMHYVNRFALPSTPSGTTKHSKINAYEGRSLSNPSSIDWTTKGVVTPVKDQGQCGSCWTFSTTGDLECNAAIKNGKLYSLSEQQILDCCHNTMCSGCNGGAVEFALQYTAGAGGLCLESAYPYTAKQGTCKADTCGTKYNPNKGYNQLHPANETTLENYVAIGCVSVDIMANSNFQHYSSGVFTAPCPAGVNHAILAVGYGYDNTTQLKYWKVKNSWGTTWGIDGYILMVKDQNINGGKGECGIAQEANVATWPL